MLEKLKKEVYKANLELPENNLVTMTSGNASARDFKTGLIVVKPSGVSSEDMKTKDMIVVNLEGKIIEGRLKPSVDALTHLYIYKYRKDVGGIVHTHSPYATSFAILGKLIPVYCTAHADEFGGPIPVGKFVLIGSKAIGKEVVKSIGRSKAILMKQHGVFTIGKTAKDAVKSAVMLEDIAKTIHLTIVKGRPKPIPKKYVEKLHKRYKEKYGQ